MKGVGGVCPCLKTIIKNILLKSFNTFVLWGRNLKYKDNPKLDYLDFQCLFSVEYLDNSLSVQGYKLDPKLEGKPLQSRCCK